MFLASLLRFFDIYTVVLAMVVFVGLFWMLRSNRVKNFPPGPMGLPLVGYMPFVGVGSNPGKAFMELKKEYGSVMSVRMGQDVWVVLNDYACINEAFVKKGEVFSGRPQNEFFDMITEGKGVVMMDYGTTWKSLRKFGLTTLRGFGVGKKGMEENVIEETPILIENLLSEKGGNNVKTKITYAVSNIICRVTFGSRFDYDDEDFKTLIEIMANMTESSWETKLLGLVTLAPFLRHLPLFKSAMAAAHKEIDKFFGVFKKIIAEHESSYNENDIRDFIDAFLKEIKQRRDDDPAFCDGQLLQYIRDLFEAGTATSASTLYWMLLAFLHFPECQEKIHDEIEAVIGDSGVPSMKQREEMPFTCAFIQEVFRCKPLLPIGVFHKATEEATLGGYTIPKNSVVMANIWSVHYDPELFTDPEKFNPERFRDGNGKFIKSNHVIPFSIGPRHCLGEQLARMEIFIFLTGIVQRLKVLPDPANPPPPFDSGFFNMLFYDSENFRVVFEKR